MNAYWRAWLLILLVAAGLIYVLSAVLLPFVAGAVLAYFLDPLVNRFEKLGLSRTLATLSIILIFFLLVVVTIVVLVPVIENQATDFVTHLPEYRHTLVVRYGPLIDHLRSQVSHKDLERLRDAAGDNMGAMASWALTVVSRILKGGLALVDIFSLFFIMPIVTFYLLRDWNVLVIKIDGWLPLAQAPIIRARLAEIDQTLSAFVRGQALVCGILAFYYGVALSLVGVDLGLVIGLLSGLLSFIPYLGMLTGLIIAVAMAFAQTGAWVLPAVVGGIFALGHLVESNFLTPKLVGDRVGLHPLWVIFALMTGGALVGMVGLLLAVPVAAIIGVLVRYTLERYLQGPLYHGNKPS